MKSENNVDIQLSTSRVEQFIYIWLTTYLRVEASNYLVHKKYLPQLNALEVDIKKYLVNYSTVRVEIYIHIQHIL